MKTKTRILLYLLLFIFLAPLQSCSQLKTTEKETYYYGIDINGVKCGYIEIKTYSYIIEEKEYGLIRTKVLNKLSVLEGDVDLAINTEIHYDPEQEGYFSNVSDISIGKTKIHTDISIRDGVAYHYESSSGVRKETEITPDVIVELPTESPHLIRDFLEVNMVEKTYKVYDDKTGEIVEKKYTRLGEEDLTLAGKSYHVLVLEEFNKEIGLKSKAYLDTKTGFQVRFDPKEDRSIYLADESVVEQINVADMNDVLFAKVGVVIPRYSELAYMKVKSTIRSTGEWLSKEDLNVTGQRFEGTVEDNLIIGVFEIEPPRYRGEDAPGFPYDFEIPDSLKKYVEPEFLIESNEAILISKAEQITEGSENSWDAAVRLSKWVSKNVNPGVPGGTSAINTYKTRKGECGSHSRLLAAFCRAMDIPARLSIGCAYIELYGGSFGQHAWTEVYMGDAGWIPVDATFGEVDYINAGHIRLGEKSSFEPVKMEILEYRYATGEIEVPASSIPLHYKPYIGKYKVVETGNEFEILFKDEKLAVDIPHKMVLLLDDPDDEGRWYPELSRQIHFIFQKDNEGKVISMELNQSTRMNKKSNPDSIDESTPADIIPYLGIYKILTIPEDFVIFYNEGRLMLDDRHSDILLTLSPAGEEGKFGNDKNDDVLFFEKDDNDEVNTIIIQSKLSMPKIDSEISPAEVETGKI